MVDLERRLSHHWESPASCRSKGRAAATVGGSAVTSNNKNTTNLILYIVLFKADQTDAGQNILSSSYTYARDLHKLAQRFCYMTQQDTRMEWEVMRFVGWVMCYIGVLIQSICFVLKLWTPPKSIFGILPPKW